MTGPERLPVQSSETGSPSGAPFISSTLSVLSASAPQWRNWSDSAGASARIVSSIGSPGTYEGRPKAASMPSTRTTAARCLSIERGRRPPSTRVVSPARVVRRITYEPTGVPGAGDQVSSWAPRPSATSVCHTAVLCRSAVRTASSRTVAGRSSRNVIAAVSRPGTPGATVANRLRSPA